MRRRRYCIMIHNSLLQNISTPGKQQPNATLNRDPFPRNQIGKALHWSTRMPTAYRSNVQKRIVVGHYAVNADFHFLACRTVETSMGSVPANPTIVVPASDMSGCSGILGGRMVILDNLTQEIDQSAFSFNGFCDTHRLDVYPVSQLLQVYYDNGVGGSGLQGTCSPTNVVHTPQNFSCVSDTLSLDCTDSWMCFSGICETIREDSTTTPFPKPPATTGSTINSLISTSGSMDAPFRPPATSSTAVSTGSSIDAPHSSAYSTATSRSNSKTTTIVASILGVLCFGLGIVITFLICRSGIQRPRWGSDVEKTIPTAAETTFTTSTRTSIYPGAFTAMEPSPSVASALSPASARASAAPCQCRGMSAMFQEDRPAQAVAGHGEE
ncbi:hypothetical protein C8F01DRAFT_1115331 [Mycena amicta]|nr:hypothetical protein C8F01DRAFT_1115331 [Mycena amicta]